MDVWREDKWGLVVVVAGEPMKMDHSGEFI